MNKNKVLEAEREFLSLYPRGFDSVEMQQIKKKHNTQKLHEYYLNAFNKTNFDNIDKIIEEMIKVVQKSSMVSLFEKPKFRDYLRSLSYDDKELLVEGLYSLLFENQEIGFNQMLFVLQDGKLAKWTIISTFLYYSAPSTEVFLKPTTVKEIIRILEIDSLTYNPKPSYKFYVEFRKIINEIKTLWGNKLGNDNAGITGVLMIILPSLSS
ncbi:MAG: hypothetical protein ACPKM0_03410 [Pleomorphochaeta sp.]